MLSPESLKSKTEGFPTAVRVYYQDFYENKNFDSLHKFVLTVLLFMEDNEEMLETESLHESTHIRTDLGINSITIAELVFFLEEVFEIEIENADIIAIETLGDLKSFITKKILNK